MLSTEIRLYVRQAQDLVAGQPLNSEITFFRDIIRKIIFAHTGGGGWSLLTPQVIFSSSFSWVKPTTYKRVPYMVKDPLEVGVAQAIFPCLLILPHIVEPLLLEARSH